MYGCNLPDTPEYTRSIPFILSKLSSYFYYPYCSFRMQKSKEATLRISIFKETKIFLTYTLEASFFGGDYVILIQGLFKDKHYSTSDLKKMGKEVCLALLVYNNISLQESNSEYSLPTDSSQGSLLNKTILLEELKNTKSFLSDLSDDSSGSDSEPSEDNLPSKELESFIKTTPSSCRIKNNAKFSEGESLSKSISSKRREISNKFLSVPRKIKCGFCGELVMSGHMCDINSRLFNKAIPISKSATIAYINLKGKKVKDQSTQTIPFEENKNLPTNESLQINKSKLSKIMNSSARTNTSEDISSHGRLWKRKYLPMIKKK